MKKQLLNESEIRKMMKFADIGTLADGYIGRLNEVDEMTPDEDEGGPGAGMTSGEAPMSVDPEGEEGLEGEEGGDAVSQALGHMATSIQATQDALRALGPQGEQVADAISVEQGDEGEGLGADEPPVDAGPDVEGPPDMAAAPGGGEDLGVDVVDDEEDTMTEVARRVARRLRAMKRRSR